LALCPMDGVFLSPSEDEFVGRIVEELEHFMEQGQHHRVLLFPPLSSRLRYLIHRTVENMELLSSFSVGEGWRRRTVICHSAVRLPGETPSEPRAASGAARGGRGARPRPAGDPHGDSARATVGSGRISRPPRRKPERAPFMPRGGRKKANWRERESPGDGEAAPGGESGPGNPSREQQELGRAGGSPGKEEPVPGKGSAEHPLCDGKVPSLGNGGDSCERESRDGDCSHSPTEALAAPEPLRGADPGAAGRIQGKEEEEAKEGSGVAEALRRGLDLAAGDREGTRQSGLEDDCTAELLAEIVGNLTVKDISIERIAVDYSGYGEAQVSEGDLGHVTEIYDFPSSLRTEDLLEMFSDFHESGFKIQWVDDTHALGIFSSLSTGTGLGLRHPEL
ncbi:R3HC1 protein, partial [Cardinalis cardinalis]|nr:R3HC1 protein [Cardinalis cardinalis]